MTKRRSVDIRIDGHTAAVPEGVTLAAALASSGHLALRRSVTGEPRAPLCGMGVCFECRVIVDGRVGVRACLILVNAGQEVRTDGAP